MATEKKGSHTWSILTGKDKRCFVTGRENGLQKHHIFHGSGKREVSDKNGFWCYLVPEKHLAGLGGLHANPGNGLDRALKCICQREYEKTHTREEFIRLIGKNYIMLDLEEAEKRKAEMEGIVERKGLEHYKAYAMEKYGKMPVNDCWLCEYEIQFVEEMGKCIHGEEEGFWLI